ncbi:DUF3558 family protein [Pseudonocardia sediminis]|uniref:DUF3558 family protein n=1 Tax=Pseudonocardia sediminis TaxID=1397368 RepID=UPI00102A09BF|nr:DUF3558 family protein [Pseudonocardia sediminis]
MDGSAGPRSGHRRSRPRTAPGRFRRTLARAAAPALVTVLALAGCGSAPEVPSPFPPRPADLRVTGLRACDSVDADDSALLGIVDTTPDPFGQGANNCVLSGPDGQVWTVRIQPGIPARNRVPGDPAYVEGDLKLVGHRVTSVDGYGAVEGVAEESPPGASCALVVDTDPDASFVLTYESYARPAGPPGGSREAGCARASQVASMVVVSAQERDRT